jgi:broad specificity phosphatase PhoE
MRLVIIRHGESESNAKKINQGSTQGKLTKKGLSQAKKTALFLSKKEDIQFIYCSDLHRTKETANEVLKRIKVPIEYSKEIRERKLGIFEGKPLGSFREYVKKNNLDLMTYKPKGGESVKEAHTRIMAFYNKCLKKHKGETILWISHGGMIRRLLLHSLKSDALIYKELHPDNCAISVIKVDKSGNKKVPVINFTDHLGAKPKTNKPSNSME